MNKVTVDTNVLIDLEKKTNDFEIINRLIELDNKKIINLYFPALIANEKLIEDQAIESFDKFIEYLKKIGIKNPKILRPLIYIDFAFLDEAILVDENGPEFQLADKLRKILFPNFQSDYGKFCLKEGYDQNSEKINSKYRNKFIDSLILWCHIYYKKDIFLTGDKNFRKKIGATKEFKEIKILTPKEFMEMI